MNIRGIVFFKNNVPELKKKTNLEYIPFGINGLIEVELFSGEDKNIRSSVIISNTGYAKSIQQGNFISQDMKFPCLEDLQNYLRSHPRIKLAICYDPDNNAIITARGVLSDIPLYYMHIPSSFFAFSTDMEELLKFEQVKSLTGIDLSSIKSYVTTSGMFSSYSNKTFLKEIKSALPGFINTATSNTFTSKTFAQFNISKWDYISDRREYGEAFRSLFANSVNNAIGMGSIIGSHLSGGLDSSSISAMIKYVYPGHTLHTIYSDTETQETEERSFALEVAKKINSFHHEVKAPHDEVTGLIKYIAMCGYPPNTIHSPARHIHLLQYQKHLGCDISLSGEGGDTIVGYGREYLDILFEQRRYTELKSELIKLVNNIKHPFFHPKWHSLNKTKQQSIYITDTIYRYLTHELRCRPANQFIVTFLKCCVKFNLSPSHLLHNAFKAFFNRYQAISIISNELTSELTTNEPVETDLSDIILNDLDARLQNSYGNLFSSISILIREEYNALAHHSKLTTHLPFYDKELLELCMATPVEIKYDSGLKRGHLREAMKGILPESVRLRIGKATFDTFARQSTLRLYQQSQDFLVDSSPVWDYIDKNKFNHLVALLKRENQRTSIYTLTFFYVNRTISLAVWLDWLKRNN